MSFSSSSKIYYSIDCNHISCFKKHEFAHLNHDVNSGRRIDVMIESEDIITEGWAVATEKYLSDAEYAAYGYSLYSTKSLLYSDPSGIPGSPYMREFVVPNTLNRQDWPFSWGYTEKDTEILHYSPLFIDLIDNENQQDYFYALGLKNNWAGTYDSWYVKYPTDNVKNFTIGELQNLLKTTNTLEELCTKVKSLTNLHGNSKSAIDNLFVNYIKHWRKHHPTTKGSEGCRPNGDGCTIYD